MDGLKAVNVYVLETSTGLTCIGAGWAIEASRARFEASLHGLGYWSATSSGSWSPTSTATTARRQ